MTAYFFTGFLKGIKKNLIKIKSLLKWLTFTKMQVTKTVKFFFYLKRLRQ